MNKTKSTTKKTGHLVAIAIITISFLTVPTARADLITLNFDSLDATGGAVYGPALDEYLAGYGIYISNATTATISVYDDRNLYGRCNASSRNVLTQGGSNDPISFQLNFSSPIENFGFTRPYLIAGPTYC